MKKLLILLSLVIIACNKDDDSGAPATAPAQIQVSLPESSSNIMYRIKIGEQKSVVKELPYLNNRKDVYDVNNGNVFFIYDDRSINPNSNDYAIITMMNNIQKLVIDTLSNDTSFSEKVGGNTNYYNHSRCYQVVK